MITFNVVRETHGWAIKVDGGMKVPFWSRDLAIIEAECLAASINRHGECTQVIVAEDDRTERAMPTNTSSLRSTFPGSGQNTFWRRAGMR